MVTIPHNCHRYTSTCIHKYSINNLQSIINNYAGDSSKEPEVCQAYYSIVFLKKEAGDISGALASLDDLKNNWDKCAQYDGVFPEGVLMGKTKEEFFDELEASIKGEPIPSKVPPEIEAAETPEEWLALLPTYQGQPEDRRGGGIWV